MRHIGWLALIVLIFAAGCAADAVPTDAAPTDAAPIAEIDPAGTDQIVSYTRNRSDRPMYVYVESASSSGGGLLGSIGCQAVGYPWTIRVGPDDRTARANRVVLHSGSATRGTATVWIDVSPEGEVLVGSGRPDWPTAAAASHCGE